jgi:hypothetical protein
MPVLVSKVTVPVGVTVELEVGDETIAVSVTDCSANGFGLEIDSVTLVVAAEITTVCADDVLVVKLAPEEGGV